MYAQLGNIQFEGLKGFDRFSGSRSINFAEHAKIEGKPRLQKVGLNLEQLTISMRFHASFCNPEAEVAALNTSCDDGEILPLILGNGSYEGDYVIQSIDRDLEQTDPHGNIVSIILTVSLKEFYNPDRIRSRQIQARHNAFATGTANAVPVRVTLAPRPSVGTVAALDVNAVKLTAIELQRDVDAAAVLTAQQPFFSRKIARNLTKMEGYLNSLQQKLANPALNILQGQLPANIVAVGTSIQNFRANLPISNINDVRTSNIALQNAVGNLNRSSTGIMTNIITRRI